MHFINYFLGLLSCFQPVFLYSGLIHDATNFSKPNFKGLEYFRTLMNKEKGILSHYFPTFFSLPWETTKFFWGTE